MPSDPTPASGLVRVPIAAQLLGLSRSKVYGLMEAGELAYVKIGTARRIDRADLQALIERCRVRK